MKMGWFWALVAILIAISIIVGFSISKRGSDGVKPENFCISDADCVKDSCCHAKGCVAAQNAPDCKGILCTQECAQNTLDCGQGSCRCVNNLCKAVIG